MACHLRWWDCSSAALTWTPIASLDLQGVFPLASTRRMQVPPGSWVVAAKTHGCLRHLGASRMALNLCAEATDTHFSCFQNSNLELLLYIYKGYWLFMTGSIWAFSLLLHTWKLLLALCNWSLKSYFFCFLLNNLRLNIIKFTINQRWHAILGCVGYSKNYPARTQKLHKVSLVVCYIIPALSAM